MKSNRQKFACLSRHHEFAIISAICGGLLTSNPSMAASSASSAVDGRERIPFWVVMNGVAKKNNVGNIMRSACAFGAEVRRLFAFGSILAHPRRTDRSEMNPQLLVLLLGSRSRWLWLVAGTSTSLGRKAHSVMSRSIATAI